MVAGVNGGCHPEVVVVETLVAKRFVQTLVYAHLFKLYGFLFLICFFDFNTVKMILVGDHFCCKNHCVVLTPLFVLKPLHV